MNYPNLERLIEIIKILRSENGCAWDREQTHSSLRKNMLEEAYEAVDAIDDNDMKHLKEELGDVLLQVVLHSQIASEENEFCIEDVAKEISDKLVRRHRCLHLYLSYIHRKQFNTRHMFRRLENRIRDQLIIDPSIIIERRWCKHMCWLHELMILVLKPHFITKLIIKLAPHHHCKSTNHCRHPVRRKMILHPRSLLNRIFLCESASLLEQTHTHVIRKLHDIA